MDSNLGPHFGRLRRFFFGDEPWKIAERDSDVEKLFQKFFFKLQTKLQRFIFSFPLSLFISRLFFL